MAESPSPYAPGIIGDQPAAPRPPARPSLFLTAAFVMTVVASGNVFSEWAESRKVGGGDRMALAVLSAVGTVPFLLVWLWAYLSDRVPLWGTRREGYVLFAALIVALAWLALAIAPEPHVTWLVAVGLFGYAAASSRAVVAGALAELGQRNRTTGRLGAAYIAVVQAAVIVTRFSVDLSSLWMAAGVAVGLCLALILLFILRADDAVPAPAAGAAAERPSIPRFLGSRVFWSSIAVCVLSGLATVPNELYGPPEWVSTFDFVWRLHSAIPIGVILVAIAYAWCCGRVRFGVLLRATMVIKAIALIVCALTGAADEWPAQLAFLSRAAANGLLSIALFDLALRVAPRGREAFGAMVLGSVTMVFVFLSNQIERMLGIPLEHVAWFAAGAALAAAIAVSLLPKAITGPSDGQVLGSPP